MHDTAFQIGGLVIDRYAPERGRRILEIGSLDVNGSLRHHATDADTYIGLDFAPGPGVDRVIDDQEPWPVEDGFFDLVMASSVLEHDPYFWETFVQMVRKTRPGGFIYLNAPSNGWIHRYPLDCWRFYPDSAPALAKWAGLQGVPVSLVESFTANRANDIWNDWCAIFRREPSSELLPDRMIHESISCKNVVCWKSEEILRFDEQPEDMTIIAEQRNSQHAKEAHILAMQSELEEAKRIEQQLSAKVILLEGEAGVKSAALYDLEQTRAREADAAKQREKALLSELSTLKAGLAQAKIEVAAAKSLLSKERLNSAEIERASGQREVLAKEDLRRALRERLEIEQRLRRSTAELAQCAHLLRNATDERAAIADRIKWLLTVMNIVDSAPRYWALRPASQRRDAVIARLGQHGLFNGAAYLQRYPDVAASGMDPLTHYLRHGMNEGREIGYLANSA